MPSEQEIENELKSKGLSGPRLTPEAIDARILIEDYYVFPGTTVTVCALMLRNGYVVIGKSGAASPENFDQEIGRKLAREDARRQFGGLGG